MSSSEIAALLTYIAISGANPFPPGSNITDESANQLTDEAAQPFITD